MPDIFFFWFVPVIIVATIVAALFTRDTGKPCAAASMTAQGFADAAAAACCKLDANRLWNSAWQTRRDCGPFNDLETALSASYAARFEQAIRTIQVGPPVAWRPTEDVPQSE